MGLQVQVADLPLSPPIPAFDRVQHSDTFGRWDDTFDVVRDAINFGLRQLRHLGADVPLLPAESLEDLLVRPFSGDPLLIRSNADGCRVLSRAVDEWGDNLGALAWQVQPHWEGRAAASYLLRVGACSTAADAAAVLVRGTARLFDSIAAVSERVAAVLERVYVRLGQALLRLSRRIAEKLAGVAGIVSSVVDVLQHGIGVITDIVDDVREILGLVDEVRQLVETMKAFVRETERGLREALALRELVPGPGLLP